MAILQVINGFLALRIVQYALVAAVLALGIFSGVKVFQLSLSRTATDKAITERDQARASVTLQNASIAALKQAQDARLADMQGAVVSAQAVAKANALKAKDLQTKLANLPKNDCQGTVDGFINLIPDIVGVDQ